MRVTLLFTFVSLSLSEHRRLPRRIHPDISSAKTNHIQDVSDAPVAFSSFSMQQGSSVIPEKAANFVTKHEQHQSRTIVPTLQQSFLPPEVPPSAYTKKHEHQYFGPPIPQHHPKYQSVGNVRHQFSEKETHLQKKKFSPEYNYILTANGKENVYTEDMGNGYKPRIFDISHPPDGSSLANKKHEKQSKKQRFAYTNPRNEIGIYQPEFETEILPDAGHLENSKSHPSGFLENQNYPQYVNPKIEIHGAKSTPWKQLGPNVEISSSAENSAFTQKGERSQEHKLNKKRKNTPKNLRASYMSPQHALYVANNLQNVRPPKTGLFDHNNVLKQSDKFEISDAMFQELEQEARKTGDSQIRIKQESPKDQLYRHQMEYNDIQYYPQQSVIPMLNVAALDATMYPGKMYQPYPLGALGKGFIQNIEIETNSAGSKKSILAMIIPLTPEQLPLFTSESGFYVNNPEVLNPSTKVRNVNPFPYDIINSRYKQNDVVNAVVPAENYQLQHTIPVGFEAYNPYMQYQNPNIFRLSYMNSGVVSSTPANADMRSPVTYSAQSITHQDTSSRSVPPYSASMPKKIQKNRYNKLQGKQQLHHLNLPSLQSQSQLNQLQQAHYSQLQLDQQQQMDHQSKHHEGLQNKPQLGQQSQMQTNHHNLVQLNSHSLPQSHHQEYKKNDYNSDYSFERNLDDNYSPAESNHITTVTNLKDQDKKDAEKSETSKD